MKKRQFRVGDRIKRKRASKNHVPKPWLVQAITEDGYVIFSYSLGLTKGVSFDKQDRWELGGSGLDIILRDVV